MNNEFTREERYIVFKLSDVERYLTDADRSHLAMMKNEIDAGRDCANKPPFKGLIVESDWPEYEPTWKAIEARVTGARSVPEESAIQTAARVMNIELIRERDALRAKIEQMERQLLDRLEEAEQERDALRAKIERMEKMQDALRRHHEMAMGAGLDRSHSLTKLRVSAYQQTCLYADTVAALEE